MKYVNTLRGQCVEFYHCCSKWESVYRISVFKLLMNFILLLAFRQILK